MIRLAATERHRIPQLVRELVADADRLTRQRQARAVVAGLTWAAATQQLLQHYETALAGWRVPCG